MMIFDKLIYGNETLEEFEKNTKYPFCASFLTKTLNLYVITKNYEKLIEYINKHDKKRYKKIINYYKYLYYEHIKDFSKRNEYYDKLTDVQKIKIRVSRASTGIEQIKIFEEKLLPIINNPLKRKKYGNLIIQLYMINASRGDKVSIINDNYQRKINKEIKRILKKSSIYINDLEYLNVILEISQMYFINNMEKEIILNDGQVRSLEIIINKVEENIEKYERILPQSKTIGYYNNICEVIRILIAITTDTTKLKDYTEKLEKIIKEKKVSEYLKELIKIQTKTKDDFFEDNLENLKNALEKNSEDVEKIKIWFQQCISQCSTIEEFKKLKENIDNIRLSPTLSKEKKNVVENELNIISFWANKKRINEITKGLKTRPFISLIINYELKNISYDEFLEELKKLRNIETYSIECWERIEVIFENNNFDWLVIILSKEIVGNISVKLAKYIRSLYLRIRKEEKFLSLETFEKIEKTYTLISKNHTLYVDSILTYIEIYDQYDKYVQNKVSEILTEITYKKNNKENVDYFIYIITMLTIQKRKTIHPDFIINLIKHIESNKFSSKIELLYCLSTIDNNLSQKYYDDFIKMTSSYYLNKKSLNEQLMSLLYTVFNNQIKGSNNYPKGKIIHHSNQMFVLDNDFIKEYNKIYECLNIKIITKEELNKLDTQSVSYDNILDVLTARVVFANIEKYGLGKKISLPENISGEKILKELEKAIGADKDNLIIKKIRNGELIKNSFWLNHYTTHKYLKDIESNPKKLFVNSKNDNILQEKIVIHYTSFVLLAKLGIIEKIVEPGEIKNKYYILNDTKKDIYEKVEKSIINYEDYIDGSVNYSELLESTYRVVKTLEEQDRIINVPSANTLGIRNLNNINSQDREMFKVIGQFFKEYVIVTEDPYYFTNTFKSLSYGTFSLVINMYQNNLLTENEVLSVTEKLVSLGYNLCIEKTLYLYLLEKEELSTLVEQINKASLNN